MCYFNPGVNMKNERITIRLSAELKEKLSENALKNGFPSATAYLVSLIEKGSSRPDNLDAKLQAIEKKIDAIADQQVKSPFSLEKIFKHAYMCFRLISYILTRTFYIKPGKVSEENMEISHAYIDREVKFMHEKYGGT